MNALSRSAAIALITLLVSGCGKPDRSLPHEYMRIRTLTLTEKGLGFDDVSSSGLSFVKWESNYFKLGSGECSQRVSKFSDDEVRSKLQLWNKAVKEWNDPLYRPGVAIELQCIASLGTDQACVENAMKKSREMNSSAATLAYLPAALNACDIAHNVGEPRLVRLN